MKIIFSRKGFDSVYGGMASPILPNGFMLSLPIPSSYDFITYSQLKLGSQTVLELIRQLKGKIRLNKEWLKVDESIRCHLDPDIYHFLRDRASEWKPLFGQSKAAQSHLSNQGIKEGDIFLFFGWFRKTIKKKDKLCYYRKDKGRHIIFGYLQIGKILKVSGKLDMNDFPEWMHYHPHFHPNRVKIPNNTIYVARKYLSFNKNIPGAGFFKYSDDLVLTKKSCTKSIWQLPYFIREIGISYHKEKNWLDKTTLKSQGRGQAFVVKDDIRLESWVKNLIESNYSEFNSEWIEF